VINAAKKKMKPAARVFEIHTDAWPSLEVFFSLVTQWQKIVVGGFTSGQQLVPLGLRYEAIEPTLRLLRVFVPADDKRRVLVADEWPDVFTDLQAMERALLEHFAKE
jgi:hypothetical protein